MSWRAGWGVGGGTAFGEKEMPKARRTGLGSAGGNHFSGLWGIGLPLVVLYLIGLGVIRMGVGGLEFRSADEGGGCGGVCVLWID